MNKIGHKAILASAGSGKTFQLAHRYIRLLAEGVPPDRICALTFSRKAAGGIFEDIVEYLGGAAASDKGAAETARRIGKPGRRRADFLAMLRQFTDSLHRQHIGTLDSFIVGVVRAFPAELGVPPEFTVMDVDNPSSNAMRWEALDGILGARPSDPRAQSDFIAAFKEATFGAEEKDIEKPLDDFITELHSEYRLLPDPAKWGKPDAVWPKGCPWLGERPGRADLSKAAEKIIAWLPESGCDARLAESIARFAAFAGAFDEKTRWNNSIGTSAIFKQLIGNADSLSGGRTSIAYSRKEFAIPAEQSRLLYALLRNMIGIEIRRAISRTAGLGRMLAQYETVYNALMRRKGSLTFEDAQYLLTAANPLSGGSVLSRLPDTDKRIYIDYRLDCKLDHWLLDEFQDTSDLQWEVLKNLADEILQDDGGRRTFFYVGDVKQAIYGWRGGNARLFNAVLGSYPPGHIGLDQLSTSFRSCLPVIETVNKTFGGIGHLGFPAKTAELWEHVWKTHECEHGRVPGHGYAALLDPPPNGDRKPEAEDRWRVVAEILKRVDPVGRALTTAILVRTNDTGKELADFLRQECHGIPAAYEGKSPVAGNPVAEVLLSLVRFATHPGDTFAWRHLQMSPLNKRISTEGNRDSLPTVLLRQIQTDGFQAFLRRWGAILNDAHDIGEYGRQRLDDLLAAAGEFDAGGGRDCDVFLGFVDGYRMGDIASAGTVRIMTVHQAKGLEFDMVILPELVSGGMNKGGQPGLLKGGTGADGKPRWALNMPRRMVAEHDTVLAEAVEIYDEMAAFESLCVLYVAMTRAKKALYMITSPSSGDSLTPAAFLKTRLADGGGKTARINDIEFPCLYEKGEPDWFLKERGGKDQREEHRRATCAPLKSSARRRLTRIEPSAHEDAIRNAGWLFDPKNKDVLAFGTAVHEMFRAVEWAADADADGIAREWAARSLEAEAVKRDACEQFLSAMRVPVIRKLLSRPDGNAELWREKQFALVIGSQQWVSGIFDRVVIMRDARGKAVSAIVLDYKSDRIAGDSEVGAAAGKYRGQLEMYRQALSQILKLDASEIVIQLLFTRVAADGGPAALQTLK